MLEIFLILAALLGAAKRRGFPRNMRVVRVVGAATLATLANVTVLAAGWTGTGQQSYWAISAKSTWALKNHTAGEGPLHVGYTHGDYSVVEIKEWFEGTGQIDRGNMVAQEQRSRRIRFVGTFDGLSSEEVLNDGKPITTKLGMQIPTGQEVDIWCYNDSGSSLTTGTIVEVNGRIVIKDN